VGDGGYQRALEALLVPVAREFRPELIVVSAGYDAHWSNTRYLSSIRMNATVAGFAAWVSLLKGLAEELCGGRLVFTLEGGYDHDALAWSVDATFRVLLEEKVEDPLGPNPNASEPEIGDLIQEYRRIHGLNGD
jgi:acetoin utilization deacetylase AcuC-like enzyme